MRLEDDASDLQWKAASPVPALAHSAKRIRCLRLNQRSASLDEAKARTGRG
jgi:hypothetical protein